MGVNVCVCTAATHIGMCTLLQSNATYQDEFEVFFRFEKKYFCSSTSLSGIANSKTSFDCCCRRHLFSALQSLPSSRLLASLSSLSSSWKRSHISNDDLRPVIKIRVMQMSFETHILVWLANYLLPTYPASYLARWG